MPSRERTVVARDVAHLGDNLYVGHDQHGNVWLWTNADGFADNSICLEQHPLASFERWLKDCRRATT